MKMLNPVFRSTAPRTPNPYTYPQPALLQTGLHVTQTLLPNNAKSAADHARLTAVGREIDLFNNAAPCRSVRLTKQSAFRPPIFVPRG
jgi:hypothetical protein